MLTRLLGFSIHTRRAYSVFSKAGGGGSYSKAPKLPLSKPLPNTSSSPQVTTPSTPNVATTVEPTGKQVSAAVEAEGGAASTSSATPPKPVMNQAIPPPKTPIADVQSLPTLGSHLHPHTTLHHLQLHNFFALDRPLLQLGQPATSLLEPTARPSFLANASTNRSENNTNKAALEDAFSAMEDEEDDMNAARLLARSLVMQRVGSSMDWSEVTTRLGLDDGIRVNMDSVKRKRKKKMTKHR